ncbi:phage terminase small subunit P27 family [bacterium]|nr:phage terminase small subunit P27 family [bacterium]
MPKGRPPRPSKIQVELRGDPSKRRKNMTEPDAPRGWPVCPQHVEDDPIACEEWKSVCTQLDSMDLLSTTDARSIELYCLTYSRFRAAQEQVRKHGDVLLLGQNKYPQVSPFYTCMNRYHDDCRKWLIEFGCTPSARARMRVKVEEKSSGKWSGILPVAG